jgi:outer membrane biosynthesis protein TonB
MLTRGSVRISAQRAFSCSFAKEDFMNINQLMSRSFVPLGAVAVLALSACNDAKKSDDAQRDVAMAATPTVGPAIQDTVSPIEVTPPAVVTPPTPAPVVAPVAPPAPVREAARPTTKRTPARAPAPARPPTTSAPPSSAPSPVAVPSAPAAPVVSSGTIASGTSFAVSNGAKVCSSTLSVGDRVTTTTGSVVSGSNGVSIPSGARVGLVVTKSKTSGSQGDAAELEFDVRSVTFGGETYPLVGSVATEAVVMERKGGDGKKVAIGAAAGAVIGNIVGGGSRTQRTVVGAAAGGLAGAATAAVTGDRLACLPEGATLTVRLGSALTVRN